MTATLRPRHPRRRRPRFEWSREDGFIAGADTLIVGTLVFVTGLVIIINTWSLMDSKFAVDAAARETVRYLAEAPVGLSNEAMENHARDIANATMAGHGKDPAVTVIQVDLPSMAQVRTRCARITVSVTQKVPTMRVPFVGSSAFGNLWSVTSDHTEIVDPFRSGLAGAAACTDE